MVIDLQNFTPYASLIGGVMIELAALLLMLTHGRVMGVSGIGGLVMPAGKGDMAWRLMFVIGMLAGPFAVILSLAVPWRSCRRPPACASGCRLHRRDWHGGRVGCTSGHGICGLARLSPRSTVAVATFMATGLATVYLVRHVLWGQGMTRHISLILIGALFGGGLALSGMLNPSKVAGFLDLFGIWDPSLAFVMGGGVVANFIPSSCHGSCRPVFTAGNEGFVFRQQMPSTLG